MVTLFPCISTFIYFFPLNLFLERKRCRGLILKNCLINPFSFLLFLFFEIQMPELLYKSLAAKLVVGMPFKVYSYSMWLHKKIVELYSLWDLYV